MDAGRLDQRVTIERQETTRDPEYNTPIVAWVSKGTVWAAVEPLNGREFIEAQVAQAEIETRIRIRYRPDVRQTDRIRHEGRHHNIVSIINPRSGDSELILMCKAVAG